MSLFDKLTKEPATEPAFLCMSEAELIIKSLAELRRETRSDMGELRAATSQMATAVAGLTEVVARVEERHARQDDGLKRTDAQVGDHEVRLRRLEPLLLQVDALIPLPGRVGDLEDAVLQGTSQVGGGWKVATVIGTCFLGLVGFLSLLVKIWL